MFIIGLGFPKDLKKSNFYLYDESKQNTHIKQMALQKKPIYQVTRNIRELLNYQCKIQTIPRILTQPSKGIYNEYMDNENNDLIIRLNDKIINNKTNQVYIAKDFLGGGTFGNVYKCICENGSQIVAIKIIKNINAYSLQAMKEIKFLRMINKKKQHNSIIQLLDYFLFQNHVCIVFPLLGLSLEELLQETKYQGLSLYTIKQILKQVIQGLQFIHSLNWVHCDIKPENILFTENSAKQVQIIDFGSVSEININLYPYIQSLYYRAPEILLGYEKTEAIDIWSVGCVAAQLYLGYPLFQGTSSLTQLSKIINLIQINEQELIIHSKKRDLYFKKINNQYEIKDNDEYINDNSKADQGKPKIQSLKELYLEFNKSSLRTIQEMALMEDFIDLLSRLLQFDPKKRLSASQCLEHPFLKDFSFNIQDYLKEQ